VTVPHVVSYGAIVMSICVWCISVDYHKSLTAFNMYMISLVGVCNFYLTIDSAPDLNEEGLRISLQKAFKDRYGLQVVNRNRKYENTLNEGYNPAAPFPFDELGGCDCDLNFGTFPALDEDHLKRSIRAAFLAKDKFRSRHTWTGYNELPYRRKEHLRRCFTCEMNYYPPKNLGPLKGKQVFWDDYLIANSTNIVKFLEEPEETKEVITPSTTYENQNMGFPGSLNHNGTHFLLHYRTNFSWNSGRHVTIPNSMALATSLDGISWKKHRLRMNESGTGFISDGVDSCVLYDTHEKLPSYRYKMIYNCGCAKGTNEFGICLKKGFGLAHPKFKGYRKKKRLLDYTCIATSPDGVHWRDHGPKFGKRTDTQACLYYNPVWGNYTYFQRREFSTEALKRMIRGTQIWTISYDTFHRYLDSDERMPFYRIKSAYLDRYGKIERYQHQIYTLVRGEKYGGMYMGFSNVYHFPRIDSSHEPFKKIVDDPLDTVDVYYLPSRDGIHFKFDWIYAKEPVPFAKEMNFKFKMVSQKFVTHKGYHYLYFSGSKGDHVTRWKEGESIWLAKFYEGRLSGLKLMNPKGYGFIETRPFNLPKLGSIFGSADPLELLRWAGHFAAVKLLVNVALPSKKSVCEVHIICKDLHKESMGAITYSQRHEVEQIEKQISFKLGSCLDPGDETRLIFTLKGQARLYGFEVSIS